MALLARIPPGRAGRLWLRRRLAAAERGRDQLDRKLRILLPELDRLGGQAESRRERWVAAYAEAQDALLQASLFGGEDVIRRAATPRPLEIDVSWATVMGVRYPVNVAWAPTQAVPAAGPLLTNTAVILAANAVQRAAEAAAWAAVAEEAVHRLETEVGITRRRLRALDRRWLPQLRAALAQLELTLEQAEQEDAVRLRRAQFGKPAGPA